MAAPLGGTVTVTTAGTRVAFPSARTRVVALKLRAAAANTGDIFIGDVTVSSSNAYVLEETGDEEGRVNWPIPEGHSIELKDIYADAAVNGETVHFLATLE